MRVALLLALIAISGSPLGASPIPIAMAFRVTDLGTGYRLQADSAGLVHGVISGDGGQTYAFEKSPVTALDEHVSFSPHAGETIWTMQNGAHRAGYQSNNTFSGTYPVTNSTTDGKTETVSNGWNGRPTDLNASGHYVGYAASTDWGAPATYAMASGLPGMESGVGALYYNNLNNYIPQGLGTRLTSAIQIDDLDRILARGEDGHVYLLTPNGLGLPSPVPEPTSLVLCILVLCGAALNARRMRAGGKLPSTVPPRKVASAGVARRARNAYPGDWVAARAESFVGHPRSHGHVVSTG
ncbi:hypothetical protein OJF2_55790 [Aquisphaera giovannonii]|uniref:PEP-CTERM protein-sorting domain-containing protein n=1 Tax=Aquisphaera giovannonii TaxID=406548 RepID=A0A5B9W9Q3_9BACT|nr:hypothetical protein [Aquisphaera giovannonii]QEH36994.1 hypothetical protein OJF2_55790 [Aquisphaera giovannonii]